MASSEGADWPSVTVVGVVVATSTLAFRGVSVPRDGVTLAGVACSRGSFGMRATGFLVDGERGCVLARMLGFCAMPTPVLSPGPVGEVSEAKSVQLADTAEIAKAAATIANPKTTTAKANTRSCSHGTTNSSKVVISLA